MNRRRKLIMSTTHPFTQPVTQLNSTITTPRSHNASRLSSMTPSKALPSINMPTQSGCVCISSLRSMYRDIHDAISDFLNHNGPTKSIRNQIQQSFFETDKYFNVFYGQISKAGRGSLPINSLTSTSILTPMIQSCAIPFVGAWRNTYNVLDKIKLDGIKMIHETIDESFNSILSALEKIINGKGYKSGIHDTNIRKARKMQQKIWSFMREVEAFVASDQTEKPALEQKLVNEMRIFSRDLSMAFTSDFSRIATIFSDNETSRNRVYNNICEVIFLIHAITVFREDQLEIESAVSAFNDIITIIIDSLQIEEKIEREKEINTKREEEEMAILEREKKETIESENEDYFDPSLPIDEIIKRAEIVFRRSNLDKKYAKQFYNSIKTHKEEYEKTIQTQGKIIKEKDQKINNLKCFKKQLEDSNEKIAQLTTTSQVLKMEKKKLEEKIEEMKKSTNVNGLRKALTNAQMRLADITESERNSVTYKTDDDLIKSANDVIKIAEEKGCKKCYKNKEIFQRLEEILGSKMYVEETQLLHNQYNQLLKEHKALKEELEEVSKERKECSDALTKILGFFDISKPSNEPLPGFALSCIPEKLALINSVHQTEIENHESDVKCLKDIMKSVLNYESGEKEKVEDIVKVLHEKIDEFRLEIDDKNSFIKAVAVRLQAHLGIQKMSNGPINQVKKLLNILEKSENPLKPIVDSLKRIQKNSLEYIFQIENELRRILGCEFPNNEEDAGIDQRLLHISEILKTFQEID